MRKLETFCFKYADGTVIERRLGCAREAAEFARSEGDHLIDWWAGKLISKDT